jgi:hypothetical protein
LTTQKNRRHLIIELRVSAAEAPEKCSD